MPSWTLRVRSTWQDPPTPVADDAERQGRHSHAERGNESQVTSQKGVWLTECHSVTQVSPERK